MKWAGRVARVGERRGACKFVVWETRGKETTWKPRLRWEDNIKNGYLGFWKGSWTGLMWLRIGTDGGLL